MTPQIWYEFTFLLLQYGLVSSLNLRISAEWQTRVLLSSFGHYILWIVYSKTCLKRPLKNRQNKDLNDNK